MEQKLQNLIDNALKISNVQNMDANNPIVLRLTHATISRVSVIVCSHREPNTLVLPINVTWFVFDPLSPFYKKALRRVSKDAADGRQHTWELIETYDDVFVEQTYDAIDTAALSDPSAPSPATTTELGIARLSVEALVASNPVVVGDNDPRMSDARTPMPHTHEEIPATMLKTSTGIVTISNANAPISGACLVATSATSATWRRLRTSDVSN